METSSSSSDAPVPDVALLPWLENALGTYRVISHYAHDHGYSQLWRLESNSQFFWLKCHQYPGKWAGEVHALTQWTAPLALAAPEVHAFQSEPIAALLTEVNGTVADQTKLGDAEEVTLWFAAGAYLARLHTLKNDWLGAANPDGTPQGETHTDPESFVRRSIESRLQQGMQQELFNSAEQTFIAYGASEWTPALAGETPRAVHRDYSPRNWMTNANGDLTGVIDFEHARWDVRAADLNRWWDTDFLRNPALADAFFDGYLGGKPDNNLQAQIQALRLLNAASGIVWATRVGDAAFAQSNRDALHRMIAEEG